MPLPAACRAATALRSLRQRAASRDAGNVGVSHYGAIMNFEGWLADTRTSYRTVAVSYADFVRDALLEQPYLLLALELFADRVRAVGGGPVADVGCGPGDITAKLQGLGVDAFGIDLSPRMVDVARRAHPGLRFDVGSMTDLDLRLFSMKRGDRLPTRSAAWA